MNLKDVQEEISLLSLIYDGINVYKSEDDDYQVIFNEEDIHFRIGFEREKCGGYLASVHYVSGINKHNYRTNSKADLELFMDMV